MLAAAGAGLFPTIQAASDAMSLGGQVYHPDATQAAQYSQLYGVYKDIYPALRDTFARLKEVVDDIS